MCFFIQYYCKIKFSIIVIRHYNNIRRFFQLYTKILPMICEEFSNEKTPKPLILQAFGAFVLSIIFYPQKRTLALSKNPPFFLQRKKKECSCCDTQQHTTLIQVNWSVGRVGNVGLLEISDFQQFNVFNAFNAPRGRSPKT